MSAQALVNDDLLLPGVPLTGTIIAGAYRVDGVLAAGGMGVVLRATELAAERQVAIKVMTVAASADREAVARFRREAKAASSLTSKHVVRVLDFGELDSGLPFLAMEHLGGTTLADVMKVRGPLPVAEAVDYVLEAIHGIAEAHALGVVHRDLKPANLFLTDTNAGPIIKVLDFGASKLTAGSSIDPGDPGGVTVATSLIGSPRYMAPEQIRAALEVDARADVYALGATLHELLSGNPIFSADNLARIFAQVLWEDPEPLSAARDDVPAELVAVVRRCLAKAPDDRYATVEALAAALAPFGLSHARSDASPVPRAAGAVLAVVPPEPAPAATRGSAVAASGSKLVAARLFQALPLTGETAQSGVVKTEPRATPTVASAAGAHVVLRATQRMTRVRMASEAPKRTTRMAAFALAARLVPGGVAAPAPTTASRPLAARTVRMTRYEADDAAAAFAGTRRFTLSRAAMVAVIGAVLMVLIVVGMGVAVARRAAQHGENAQAPAGRDGR